MGFTSLRDKLLAACEGGDLSAVHELLRQPASKDTNLVNEVLDAHDGQRALHIAVERGNEALVTLLLAQCAKLSPPPPPGGLRRAETARP